MSLLVTGLVILTGLLVVGLVVWYVLPRRFRGSESVASAYDNWTQDQLLERLWGEHIHLGYYGEDERRAPFYGGKDFVEAKYDFIDKMLEFSKARAIRRNYFGAILRNSAQCCTCLLYTSPSPRDKRQSRMPSSA